MERKDVKLQQHELLPQIIVTTLFAWKEGDNMIVDLAWSGGLVVGIQHTDTAVIETGEDEYEFCNAIIISLGFFNISFLFI
jgi:hypothetical protein